jgi:hypothetical protein
MKNFVLAVLMASAITPGVAGHGHGGGKGTLFICKQPDGNIQTSSNICFDAYGTWEPASLDLPSLVGVF